METHNRYHCPIATCICNEDRGIGKAISTLRENGWRITKSHWQNFHGFWWLEVVSTTDSKLKLVYEITTEGDFNNTFHTWPFPDDVSSISEGHLY